MVNTLTFIYLFAEPSLLNNILRTKSFFPKRHPQSGPALFLAVQLRQITTEKQRVTIVKITFIVKGINFSFFKIKEGRSNERLSPAGAGSYTVPENFLVFL